MRVWCLTDGGTVFGSEVFPALDAEAAAARLAASGLTGIRTEFGAYVIAQPDGTADLVDTGCGAFMGAAGGALADRMRAIDVPPADIRNLIFTHLHPDHCGGAVIEGSRAFSPEAVFVHEAEIAHWQGGESPAAETLRAYDAQLAPVGGGAVLPGGFVTWALPGHTPGHMGLRIGPRFALTGDIVHSQALQLPDPGLGPIYDTDPVLAAASRRVALAEMARTRTPFSGSHNIAPWKVHRVVPEGAGYRPAPA